MPKKPIKTEKMKKAHRRVKQRRRLKDTVRIAVKLGNLSIVPPKDNGSKKPFPLESGCYQERKATQAERDDWYEKRELTGFGLFCGEVSDDLECLDFGGKGTYSKFCKHMKDNGRSDLLNRLQHGYKETTPNGVHLLYRCAEIGDSKALATRPTKGRHIEVLIKVIGEGGYVVCAPSYGPGKRNYRLKRGGLATIPLITPDERQELFKVAKSFHVTNPVTAPELGVEGKSHDSQ